MYLNKDGRFLGRTVEDAMTFASVEAASEYVLDRERIEIEYLAAAVAREDQEYALELEDLRG